MICTTAKCDAEATETVTVKTLVMGFLCSRLEWKLVDVWVCADCAEKLREEAKQNVNI